VPIEEKEEEEEGGGGGGGGGEGKEREREKLVTGEGDDAELTDIAGVHPWYHRTRTY
jgi:hypothetical protein